MTSTNKRWLTILGATSGHGFPALNRGTLKQLLLGASKPRIYRRRSKMVFMENFNRIPTAELHSVTCDYSKETYDEEEAPSAMKIAAAATPLLAVSSTLTETSAVTPSTHNVKKH